MSPTSYQTAPPRVKDETKVYEFSGRQVNRSPEIKWLGFGESIAAAQAAQASWCIRIRLDPENDFTPADESQVLPCQSLDCPWICFKAFNLGRQSHSFNLEIIDPRRFGFLFGKRGVEL